MRTRIARNTVLSTIVLVTSPTGNGLRSDPPTRGHNDLRGYHTSLSLSRPTELTVSGCTIGECQVDSHPEFAVKVLMSGQYY